VVDVRFKRLAVSILDTRKLAWYFTHSKRMPRATFYCEVDEEWSSVKRINANNLALFLTDLHNTKFEKFISLLTYILNDLPKYGQLWYNRGPAFPPYSYEQLKEWIHGELTWFFREMFSIGILWDGKKFTPATGTPTLDIEIKSQLETMLSKLGSEYLARYNGALESLLSNKPDSLSQSLGSMVQLLRDVLNKLTEDDVFTEDEKDRGKPTRKAKLKHIVDRSGGLGAETELADSISDVLIDCFSALNKGYHVTTKKDWITILYIFKSTEYLMYYILSQSPNV